MEKKVGSKKEKKFANVSTFAVSRVHLFGEKNTVGFNLTINDVSIYNCTVVETVNGDFIGFPSKKGKDGNYYNEVYVALTDKDQSDIIAEIQRQINEG